jgi:hypothetical protein
MTSLSRSIVWYMVSEFGREFFLRRLSDPYWFQALGSVLAFDWHSSGLTTTVTGALKQGLKGMEKELGMFMAGGKGAASRKTPEQISSFAESNHVDPGGLIYASRMSAKATQAGCPPRQTTRPCRTATRSTTMSLPSASGAPGRWCSRG